MQLAFGMEAGVRPQAGARGWGADPTGEAIAFIDATLPAARARANTARSIKPARPVVYLYARQNDELDQRLVVPRDWHALRFVAARDGTEQDVVADWLRLTGERSTRRTETYGDTRSRWKVADHWAEKRGAPRRCWALDHRSVASSDEIANARARFGYASSAVLGFHLKGVEQRGATVLSTTIQPLVLIAAWEPWLRTAIALAHWYDASSESWSVVLDQLATQGNAHHEAIARATIEHATANAVIVRALAWVHAEGRPT